MYKVKRKFKKLMRDPKLFFSDMYLKHKHKFDKFKTKKHYSPYQYAVVSAVYNSAKYLDDYFKSITEQSLDFKKHIQIICIDDGSTDNSAEIIKKWQSAYPENIIYFYKENGGQASARNIGLKYLKSDWVSFMDSDDFLDKDYFYYADKAIRKHKNIKMVCCNQIYYFEDKKQFIDRHPLNYRFQDSNNIVSCSDLGKNIQFSAALSFLHVKSIPNMLKFDEQLKPTFEDGKFVNQFLLNQAESSQVYFQPKSLYLNRKRADKSSTMDGIWAHKGTFSTVFERGYLDILPKCKAEKGFIPTYLQRTILWEMLKLVKQLMNHEERVYFLTEAEKEKLLSLMDETFSYIDKDTIMSYELGNCGFSRQLGMLGCFKKLDVDRQVVYIDKIDTERQQFLLRYFSCFDGDCLVTSEQEELKPLYYKKSIRKFLSRTFLTEHRLWLPIVNEGNITISVDGKVTIINFQGKRYKSKLPSQLLFKKTINNEGYWVLMDRDDSAGDNAEFLYDYLKNENKYQNIVFILNKSSKDWKRLKAKNFNLIEHGSKKHKEVLERASLLVSSQIGSIIDPFHSIKKSYKTIFLQHGVTKDNISNWLNNVKMDLMVTATKQEHHSIADDYSSYIYGDKEIHLLGFPRFDSLYTNRNKFKNQVMLMFTWRKSIAGNFVQSHKSEREFNQSFTDSDYYKKINEFLNHPKLAIVAEKYGTNFVFCPHPNMKPYLKLFDFPHHVKAFKEDKTIHELINESAMVVTDYSSIAFDFAYQNKPVCYYQFDKAEFFSGEHTYTKGYFDYETDGFGEVCENADKAVSFISNAVNSCYKNQKLYSSRILKTFKYIDSKNSFRVYEMILNTFTKENENKISIQWLRNQAEKSFLAGNWAFATYRYKALIELNTNALEKIGYKERLIRSLIYTGEFEQAQKQILMLSEQTNANNSIYLCKSVGILQGLLYFYLAKFEESYTLLSKYQNELEDSDILDYARCLFELGKADELARLNSSDQLKDDCVATIIKCLNENLTKAGLFIGNLVLLSNSLNELNKKKLNLDLVLAEILFKKGEILLSFDRLVKFETYAKNPMRRYLIAKIAYQRKRYNKVVNQIEALNYGVSLLGNGMQKMYYDSVNKTGE